MSQNGKQPRSTTVGDRYDNDVTVIDSQPYIVTFRSGRVRGVFRGWYSAERSNGALLHFSGNSAGEWLMLTDHDITHIVRDHAWEPLP